MDELCTDFKNIFCTHELPLNANWSIIFSDCPLSQGLEEGQKFLSSLYSQTNVSDFPRHRTAGSRGINELHLWQSTELRPQGNRLHWKQFSQYLIPLYQLPFPFSFVPVPAGIPAWWHKWVFIRRAWESQRIVLTPRLRILELMALVKISQEDKIHRKIGFIIKGRGCYKWDTGKKFNTRQLVDHPYKESSWNAKIEDAKTLEDVPSNKNLCSGALECRDCEE